MRNFNSNIRKYFTAAAMICCMVQVSGQGDSSLLGNEPEIVEKVQNAFKTTKVINLQSTEVTDAGVLDFKINHRFGALNTGANNAFGLDQAFIRIGFEYGAIPNLMLGIGRTSVDKTLDGYFKYRIMHQTSDNKKPFSLLLFGDVNSRRIKFPFLVSQSQRLAYCAQLILGRKFSESFSLELAPSYVHYNLAPFGVSNDQYALGIGLRQKITNRLSVNLEYIPLLGANGVYKNSLSLGCDIETGGHVFQLHLTNSNGMVEPQFIGRNDNTWQSGSIRFGFNISRVFTLVDPSRFPNNSY